MRIAIRLLVRDRLSSHLAALGCLGFIVFSAQLAHARLFDGTPIAAMNINIGGQSYPHIFVIDQQPTFRRLAIASGMPGMAPTNWWVSPEIDDPPAAWQMLAAVPAGDGEGYLFFSTEIGQVGYVNRLNGWQQKSLGGGGLGEGTFLDSGPWAVSYLDNGVQTVRVAYASTGQGVLMRTNRGGVWSDTWVTIPTLKTRSPDITMTAHDGVNGGHGSFSVWEQKDGQLYELTEIPLVSWVRQVRASGFAPAPFTPYRGLHGIDNGTTIAVTGQSNGHVATYWRNSTTSGVQTSSEGTPRSTVFGRFCPHGSFVCRLGLHTAAIGIDTSVNKAFLFIETSIPGPSSPFLPSPGTPPAVNTNIVLNPYGGPATLLGMGTGVPELYAGDVDGNLLRLASEGWTSLGHP